MPSRLAAVLALPLLLPLALAGCSDTDTPGPGPFVPEAGDPWSTPQGGLWVAYSDGCGFCGPGYERADFRLVALYRDGAVLAVDYGRGPPGGPEMDLNESAGLEPYREILEALFAKTHSYATAQEGTDEDRPMRVHAANGRVLEAGDRKRIAAGLEDALRSASEPEGEIDRTDCGPAVTETFGEPREARVGVGCGIEGGDGWEVVMDTLVTLDSWARP